VRSASPPSLSRASGLVLSLVAVVFSASPGLARPPADEGRGKPFWLALAKDCAVPQGGSAIGLVSEAVSFLGSPDTEWRDDVGYGVVASCVYQKRLLTPGERRELVVLLSDNLRKGIGETDTDTVLLRSFSALDLSILAALENADPALDDAGYRRLLDDALAYLRDERDLRGLEPRIGWIHATAHTADLLKFLARDKRLKAADQARLLDAVSAKMTAPGTPVFTHAEDERLAAALVSVVRRQDFDAARLDPWLARFVDLEKQVWSKAPPDPPTLDASQNARSLLRSLYVLLSSPAEGTSGQGTPAGAGASAKAATDGAAREAAAREAAAREAAAREAAAREAAARAKVLATLAAIRR
jgi:hypothetical protein